jgi:hypothetical protein
MGRFLHVIANNIFESRTRSAKRCTWGKSLRLKIFGRIASLEFFLDFLPVKPMISETDWGTSRAAHMETRSKNRNSLATTNTAFNVRQQPFLL